MSAKFSAALGKLADLANEGETPLEVLDRLVAAELVRREEAEAQIAAFEAMAEELADQDWEQVPESELGAGLRELREAAARAHEVLEQRWLQLRGLSNETKEARSRD